MTAAVKRSVAALPPDQRAAFVLRHVEGCTYAQIAAILETTLSAVKSRLHRARAQIARDLREWR
jgi:RNA polymerase sigma-70 factor (ECF subfamily)